jgi:hypothetical protein
MKKNNKNKLFLNDKKYRDLYLRKKIIIQNKSI